MQIHVARDGKQIGVFSLEEVRQQLAAGTLSISDQAWYEGAAGWAPLSSVPGVSDGTPAAAAPAPLATATAATMVPQRRNEPLAIVSLILSIAGVLGFCCGFFLFAAIGGIVCGHIALSRIKQDPTLEGHGLAMAGVVIGYVALVGWLAWVVLFGGLAVLQGISESMMKH